MEIISSKTNKKVRLYKSLKNKKYRDKEGLFIVEGIKMVEEARESSFVIEDILVSESSPYLDAYKDYTVLTESVFKDISHMKNPEGVMAVIKEKDLDLVLDRKLICLDGLKDPGNLGTIIRSMDAFGFKNLLLMPETVDPYNPKTLRASMGSIFRIGISQVDEEKVISLKDKGYKIIASSLEGAVPIKEVEVSDKYMLVIGSESHGISKFMEEIADELVKIPISDKVDSLNAAIATGVFLYDFVSR